MTKIEVKEIKPQTKMPIEIARAVMNATIDEYRSKLETVAKTKEGDPILVEGETSAGYYCQMMVDPAEVAEILVRWDYPLYQTLEEEAPQGMWDELAEHFGLKAVSSFEL